VAFLRSQPPERCTVGWYLEELSKVLCLCGACRSRSVLIMKAKILVRKEMMVLEYQQDEKGFLEGMDVNNIN
jgi:hypothetical protein